MLKWVTIPIHQLLSPKSNINNQSTVYPHSFVSDFATLEPCERERDSYFFCFVSSFSACAADCGAILAQNLVVAKITMVENEIDPVLNV